MNNNKGGKKIANEECQNEERNTTERSWTTLSTDEFYLAQAI